MPSRAAREYIGVFMGLGGVQISDQDLTPGLSAANYELTGGAESGEGERREDLVVLDLPALTLKDLAMGIVSLEEAWGITTDRARERQGILRAPFDFVTAGGLMLEELLKLTHHLLIQTNKDRKLTDNYERELRVLRLTPRQIEFVYEINWDDGAF